MRRYSGFIIVLLLAAVIVAPVDVPFTLESVAKAMPVRQWILLKSPDGSLSSTLHDNRSGQVKNAEGYQFDRGDMVYMNFNGGGEAGNSIRADEEIAVITSITLGEQLVRLKNQLVIEKANLNVVATGQKKQLITQLEEEINLAKEDLKLRQKTLDRAKQLYQDGLIALADMETAENAYNESAARVKVAEKTLTVGATGEKQETVSLASSKINSLQSEITFLENKQSKYTITAPFEGLIRFETLPEGERLLLEDTSAAILLIPVRLRDSRFVKTGQEIELHLVDTDDFLNARVLDISDRVQIISMERVVIAKALVTKNKELLSSGMPVRCRIHCENVRISEFLRRSIRWQ